MAAALERDGYIRTARIESVLNNFNDLPGISAAGILSAGEAIGSTDLTIALHDGKTAEHIVYSDNYGGKYSGRYRYGFRQRLIIPAGSAIKFLQAGC